MKTIKTAVLCSGGGTNLQAIIDSAAAGQLPHAELALVVGSKDGIFSLERAEKAGIPHTVVARRAYDSQEAFALARQLQPIWRKAAKRMLDTDYYPLTRCRKSSDDFYAAQFHDGAKQEGVLNLVNGATAMETDFTVKLKGLQADMTYVVTSAEQNKSWEATGAELMAGVAVHMPKKTGDVWFIDRK